jgi:hypothetical protein
MPEHKPPYDVEDLSRFTFAASFVSALIFLYLRTFVFPATPLVAGGDQVLFFVRGLRMTHGQVLYRDFFEVVTPGTDLLYAATFRIFGVHAWIMPAWYRFRTRSCLHHHANLQQDVLRSSCPVACLVIPGL